ncbi:V/A-type H+-transporting ATPase subunit E [Porphyromonas crevioricanis]|nr:V/A-type H+-transporting ATPase subunit E [Porphyromonas crevioricanis]
MMDSKIQELTDKIYREGVEKGNSEAAKIVSEAEAKRAELIKQAKAEAEQIVSDAKKKAADLEKNTQSELKLYADQMRESLKSAIADQLTGKIVSSNVKAATADPDFVRQLILTLAKNWQAGEQIVIGTADAEGLINYFAANAKDLLDKQVKIEEVAGKPADFTISPANGAYKVMFGEEQFINLFKSFLRPKLVEMLF